MSEGVKRIHCEVCGRDLGITSWTPRGPFYCDLFCAGQPVETPYEERDSLLEYLAADGYSYSLLADLFGVSSQRVGQILEFRREALPALRLLRKEKLPASA